ncbi:MAG TPA: hypothetical protein VFF72_13010 [Caldimonas sp.]|nr:hypothetical protein [Caldimonas sp.]
MSARPPGRTWLRSKPARNDDDAGESAGKLRWARSLLTRSVGLEKRGKQLHVVLVERDRGPGARPSASPLQQMRDELQARLLVHDPSTQAIRNLYVVYKELSGDGWPAVEMLPHGLTQLAQVEAEILQTQEPSPVLAGIIERLVAVNAATAQRIELEAEVPVLDDEATEHWAVTDIPEVSEASHEEYERMERSWIGTVPAEL